MELDAAITRALAETGLPAGLASIVRTLHEQPDDSWRACCQSQCRPCSLDLARAVDRVRELLAGHD